MPSAVRPSRLLLTIAEPTRLRILNCLAAGPLCVSDLRIVLGILQPAVSRHLTVLRRARVVEGTAVGQFMLYRLRRGGVATQRLLTAVLESLTHEEEMRLTRHRALDRSRSWRERAMMPGAA